MSGLLLFSCEALMATCCFSSMMAFCVFTGKLVRAVYSLSQLASWKPDQYLY